MCTGCPRQDPLVVHYLVSTLSLGVGTCHVTSWPPRRFYHGVSTFSIFLYLLCLHHPSLSSFCKFGQEFHFTIQNSPPPPFVHNTGSYAKHWGFWHEYADAMMLATYRVSVDPRVRIIQSNQIGSTFLQVGGKFSTFQTSSAHLRQV